MSSVPNKSQVIDSYFPGWGWAMRQFPVLLPSFLCNFEPDPWSTFKIWVHNLKRVLNIKFQPYPINNSQVIFFLRSIITCPEKRLLTAEGIVGGVSFTRGLFWGWCLMNIAAIKPIFPRLLVCVNCLFPV